MRAVRSLAAVALTGLIVGSGVGTHQALAEPADLATRLDAAIESRIAQMGVPGAIVSLSIPGEIDYVNAFGVANTATGVPMMPDFHTRIGSVTKTFTGTAVLQLVDRGLIRLDDPISRYVDGVPNGDVITIDMLGRMRSGLPDYTETPFFINGLYSQAPMGPDAFATTPQQSLAEAFALPVDFAPDADYEYSNTNTVLLAQVVEKVSGLSFADFLQQNIFGPVGLSQTSWPPNGVMPGPFASGYNQAADDTDFAGQVFDATLWNPSWGDAAGQIVSNVYDMKTWAATLGRGTLLNPATQTQRITNGTEVVPGVSYAFAIFNANGWLGHNGDIPGYATVVVYLPERDATLVVFVNSDIPQPHSAGQIAYDITKMVTPDHLYELGPQPPLLLEDN